MARGGFAKRGVKGRKKVEAGAPSLTGDNAPPFGKVVGQGLMTEGGHDAERDQLPSRTDKRRGPFSLNKNIKGKRGK